jgi:uncharacterized protein (TIGR00106 family)
MLCEFSISPVGKESMSDEVARIIDLIDRSGIPYKTHAMGTVVEGSWDEVIPLIRQCHELMKSRHTRVSTRIVIDDRSGKSDRLAGKIDAVERHLGRKISK